MLAPRLTHEDREGRVLADLNASFPDFTGTPVAWTKIPDGQDPPDFIGTGAHATLGLELVEWLDGDQMSPAKAREAQKSYVHRVLAHDWENQYKPKHFRAAFPSPLEGTKIAAKDVAQLRFEFYAFAAKLDGAWTSDTERWGSSDYRTDFPGFPLLTKYFNSINFVGGAPLGLCWISLDGDGGAFDPNAVVATLTQALDNKMTAYSISDRQANLSAQHFGELDLLVHGGSNVAIYNAPAGHLTLPEIAQRGAAYYAVHPLRNTFGRVWFFHSVDAADDVNAVLGIAPDTGRIRWLAQLWPTFAIRPGSKS
jgi:hypothetical protein